MLYIRHMIRTQVYLLPEQAQEIAFLAKKQKTERAKIIRNLIQKGLELEQPKETLGQALQKLIDLGEKITPKDGPTDLSTNHDKYLYEDY